MKPLTFLALALTLPLSVSTQTQASTPLVDFLRQLVEISSGTRQVPAVNQIQSLITQRLKTAGFEIQTIEAPGEPKTTGQLLVATRIAKHSAFVTLLMHADTVFEPDSHFLHFKKSDDGLTATGPGVIDNKGGIVVALGGLTRYLQEHPDTLHSFRVVVSPNEETGSNGFLEKFREYAKDSKLVLGFEPALDDGSIIGTRRGNRWYKIQVTGREAHAGRAHREGINACQELAAKLTSISQLTNYKKDVTVSIGHVEGGKDKFNIVCGQAMAKVDVRFADLKSRDELHRKIDQILRAPGIKAHSDGKKSELTYQIDDDCPPFSQTPASRDLFARYAKILSQLEKAEVKIGKSGGAADANYFSTLQNVVIDGLGPRGGKMHTAEEFIALPSLETRALALKIFLEKL